MNNLWQWRAREQFEDLSGYAVFIVGNEQSEAVHMNTFKTAVYMGDLLKNAYLAGLRDATDCAVRKITALRDEI